jgi:hypothetical protein
VRRNRAALSIIEIACGTSIRRLVVFTKSFETPVRKISVRQCCILVHTYRIIIVVRFRELKESTNNFGTRLSYIGDSFRTIDVYSVLC